jgi:transposase
MAIIRSREALVSARTQLVNHVRGAVKSFGGRLPKCPARSFHSKAAEHIPEDLGLVPATEKSGDRDPQRCISKEGDEMLSVGSW